jgi:hypothetical protein
MSVHFLEIMTKNEFKDPKEFSFDLGTYTYVFLTNNGVNCIFKIRGLKGTLSFDYKGNVYDFGDILVKRDLITIIPTPFVEFPEDIRAAYDMSELELICASFIEWIKDPS